jgi:sugar O-acyltransferase (sialic acid O-acetyltransferase NeuD family)
MIIIGAGNLGLHVLDTLLMEKFKEEIVFYDDKENNQDLLLGKYRIISSLKEVQEYINNSCPDFIAAIGNNRIRAEYVKKFENVGGNLSSVISGKANISSLIPIPSKIIIQPGVTIAHNVSFGKSCVIHANSVIGHDVKMGDFVSVATLTTIIGPCEIGDFTFIGTNCVVLPKIKIGKNVIVTTGKIVNENLDDYTTF